MNSAHDVLNPIHPTETAADTVVGVSGLEVLRGGRRVLPGVSLAIRRGVITGLLGPSGSGKSTLMRAIVGVQTVAGGEVTVLGRPAGTAELRRRVAYVTQAPSVYADLTVRENLEYFTRILDAAAGRIDATIAKVGLERQAGQVVGTLSGGERSRASLAVALLHDPELLVLDEPTVGLDPVLRSELWATFHALAEEGRTLIVSTHVMDEAERCDELVLMREGRVVASGSPAALREETRAETVEQAFIALAERAA
jgi:ABC-2 type transport system ATP-binding protein